MAVSGKKAQAASVQGPVRHQYEAHHAQNVELEDLIWREHRIICSVKAGQDVVKIRTESYADFVLAKSAIKGRVSEEIVRAN